MCLRFRGCPVVIGIELSVSARHHQKTRVLLAVRAASCMCCLLLLVAAAGSGGVRHNFPNYMVMRVAQNNEFGPIRAPENTDFWRPTTATAKLPSKANWRWRGKKWADRDTGVTSRFADRTLESDWPVSARDCRHLYHGGLGLPAAVLERLLQRWRTKTCAGPAHGKGGVWLLV